jgi:hypothetical protein
LRDDIAALDQTGSRRSLHCGESPLESGSGCSFFRVISGALALEADDSERRTVGPHGWTGLRLSKFNTEVAIVSLAMVVEVYDVAPVES